MTSGRDGDSQGDDSCGHIPRTTSQLLANARLSPHALDSRGCGALRVPAHGRPLNLPRGRGAPPAPGHGRPLNRPRGPGSFEQRAPRRLRHRGAAHPARGTMGRTRTQRRSERSPRSQASRSSPPSSRGAHRPVAGGAPRPAREGRGRGGQRRTTGEAPGDARRESGGTRGGGQVAPEGCGSRPASAAHLPSARFMPASAAQRGSAGPGPVRHRFCFRRQSASSAAAAEPAEDEPEAAWHSCSRATGSVRFLIPWPAPPASPSPRPSPPAAAQGSSRSGEPPPPRARRPDVLAGRGRGGAGGLPALIGRL